MNEVLNVTFITDYSMIYSFRVIRFTVNTSGMQVIVHIWLHIWRHLTRDEKWNWNYKDIKVELEFCRAHYECFFLNFSCASSFIHNHPQSSCRSHIPRLPRSFCERLMYATSKKLWKLHHVPSKRATNASFHFTLLHSQNKILHILHTSWRSLSNHKSNSQAEKLETCFLCSYVQPKIITLNCWWIWAPLTHVWRAPPHTHTGTHAHFHSVSPDTCTRDCSISGFQCAQCFHWFLVTNRALMKLNGLVQQ